MTHRSIAMLTALAGTLLVACAGPRAVKHGVTDVVEHVEPIESGPREWTSPGGRTYAILNSSDENSSCHAVEESGESEPDEAGVETQSEMYAGKARAKVKTTVSSQALEEPPFEIPELVGTIPDAIPDAPQTKRDSREDRNVTVDAYLYAAKRETDNDYHLIIGTSPETEPTFFNAEVSGLISSGASKSKLTAARAAYKAFFGGAVPTARYATYSPPIPVRITGSLFYDTEHNLPQGECSVVGTGRCHPCTAWEVHPVTAIEFELAP